MKKFYVLIVVIICSAAQGFSQTVFTWTGTASNEWENASNWTGGTGYPDDNMDEVLFNINADVEISGNITVKSITVTGNRNVRIKGITGNEELKLESGSLVVAPAIIVDQNNTLRFFQLMVTLSNNIQGTINGSLELEGTNDFDYALVQFPSAVGQPAAFNINGTLNDKYGSSIICLIDDYLRFNNNSNYVISGTLATIVPATYSATSQITITGLIDNSVSFKEVKEVGTVVYNCAGQNDDQVYLNIPPGLKILGSLNIQNSNNRNLILLTNNELESGQTNFNFTVNGDLNVTGNSKVSLAMKEANDGLLNIFSGTVNGDFVMSGNSFSINSSNLPGIQPATLFVKGNINHTAGSITATSNILASTASLFNIEMNGTTAQTITSTSQSFNNAGNQVALRISNPNGVTLLTPLNVGMLGFSSNGKLITDETNFVKVMNPSTAAYVVSGSGFVQGPVRRETNLATEYIFPTGAGTTARYVSVFPAATTTSTYQASYTNAAPANTTVTSPLINIANYYWEVDRISTGANAYVEITLPGAVSGANSSHALVVSKSSGGADWVSSRNLSDNTFLPGDATSGKIRSELQTSFSSFTIGWGPMDAVLPINLLSFTVNKSGSKANLNWKITGNSTPQSFDIMKSSDGVNFSKIGTVQGLTAKLSYDFTDNNLLAGNNYYRLKMFDIDGTISYSNIIVAMNGTSGTLITSMMPTMVIDRARLNISSASKGNMQLVITDINGRIIQTQNASINAGNQEVWINATRLATGFFQITGYINGEKTATIRFFKR